MKLKFTSFPSYLFIFCLILFCSSLAYGHSQQKTLQFQLTGAPGIFRELQPVYYGIHVENEQKIIVQFSASELNYVGPYQEKAKLNVVYWLNTNLEQSFNARQPLVLKLKKGLHEFLLQGQVVIDAVEQQPAGDYEGVVTITVFEQLEGGEA